jgi:hypothetical protein
MSEAAAAQCRGPPRATVESTLDADTSRQDDLQQRLQNLQQKLSRRSDGAAAQMLSQARALQSRLQSQPNLSNADLNNIEATVQRLESTVG